MRTGLAAGVYTFRHHIGSVLLSSDW